uniref:hypothetical protein n=1 Tax=Arthrobacter sp. TaxID=1667 RepID=UPI00159EBC2E|nr:hypothetical protein [Arthrobacter sp.]
MRDALGVQQAGQRVGVFGCLGLAEGVLGVEIEGQEPVHSLGIGEVYGPRFGGCVLGDRVCTTVEVEDLAADVGNGHAHA